MLPATKVRRVMACRTEVGFGSQQIHRDKNLHRPTALMVSPLLSAYSVRRIVNTAPDAVKRAVAGHLERCRFANARFG
jgi:hypothetical protein